METFKIEVQEVLSRIAEVTADNINDAISLVTQMYNSEEIVLDYNDLLRKDIIPFGLTEEKESLTKEIIEYLYIDKKRHFEELNKPNNHIFSKLERLKNLIN